VAQDRQHEALLILISHAKQVNHSRPSGSLPIPASWINALYAELLHDLVLADGSLIAPHVRLPRVAIHTTDLAEDFDGSGRGSFSGRNGSCREEDAIKLTYSTTDNLCLVAQFEEDRQLVSRSISGLIRLVTLFPSILVSVTPR
jgi:hypothetical protein